MKGMPLKSTIEKVKIPQFFMGYPRDAVDPSYLMTKNGIDENPNPALDNFAGHGLPGQKGFQPWGRHFHWAGKCFPCGRIFAAV